MYKKKFNKNDQIKFSILSGDFNPIHLNYSYALKSMFQKNVIYGINIVIWALEKTIKSNIKNLIRIKIEFLKPTFLEEEIFLNLKKNKNFLQIIIKSKKEEKIRIKCFFSEKKVFFYKNLHLLKSGELSHKTVNNLKDIKGYLYLQKNKKLIIKNYPKINNSIAIEKILRLISLSRLVGSQLNNKPSILASIDLFYQNQNLKNKISFKLKKFIKKFSFCELNVEGNGIKSKVEAFIIPDLPDYSFKNIRKKVKKNLFSKNSALIIGGSSGLGEITVKILSAGNANVIFTYNKNSFSAKRIILEIKKNNKNCMCFKFDVTRKIKNKNFLLKIKNVQSIYYFPTPKISTSNKFDKKLYKKYLKYYVFGFKQILNYLKNNSHKIKVFFPSTIFIEKSNKLFGEYIKAKKEAEIICDSINKKNNLKCKVLYERLPRILTRQSLSFYNLKHADGFNSMFNIVKKINKTD